MWNNCRIVMVFAVLAGVLLAGDVLFAETATRPQTKPSDDGLIRPSMSEMDILKQEIQRLKSENATLRKQMANMIPKPEASTQSATTKADTPKRPAAGMSLAEVQKVFETRENDPVAETSTTLRFYVFIRDHGAAQTDAPHWLVDMAKDTQKITAVVSVGRW